jgi:hypothetical protein
MPLRIKGNTENMLFNFFFFSSSYCASSVQKLELFLWLYRCNIHGANASRPDTVQIKISQHCQNAIPPFFEGEALYLNTYMSRKGGKMCPWISGCHEARNDCADEGEQQFNWPTDCQHETMF